MSQADQSYSVCQLERKIVETLPTHIFSLSLFRSFALPNTNKQISSVRFRDVSTLMWNEIPIEEILNVEEQSDRLDENQRDPHGEISVSCLMFLDPSHSITDGKLHDHRQETPGPKHSQRDADQILKRDERRESEWKCQQQCLPRGKTR